MKKIIPLAFALVISLSGCYTQIGTLKEDEGYTSSERKREYVYSDNYELDSWVYQSYAYRYYLPYPRYYLFFRYYTPGFAVGWGEWWYYDPFWWDYYWWDRYYWYSYWYLPAWYYNPWWYWSPVNLWWYRTPVVVIINNPPAVSKPVIYRTRTFGSTRGVVRDREFGSGAGESSTISPPSRTIPRSSSNANVGGTDEGATLRKPSSSGRETPSIDRGREGEKTRTGTRETGSTRTSSTPRIVPRSNDGSSGSPRHDSTPPQRRTPPPRKIEGYQRSSIQTYRDYNTGRSTLIEMPRHNLPRNESYISNQPNSSSYPNFNGAVQSERRIEQRRQMGNRR